MECAQLYQGRIIFRPTETLEYCYHLKHTISAWSICHYLVCIDFFRPIIGPIQFQLAPDHLRPLPDNGLLGVALSACLLLSQTPRPEDSQQCSQRRLVGQFEAPSATASGATQERRRQCK